MIRTSDIAYKADIPLKGYLAFDDATSTKRPGILLCHEGGGLGEHVKERSRRLAGLGYVAFCLDMYGVPITSMDQAMGLVRALMDDVDKLRARGLAGLAVLKSQPLVAEGKLACIGFCMGGTTVLEIARSGADVKGVVSFHGVLDTVRREDAKNIKARVLVCTGSEDPLATIEQRTAFEKEMQSGNVDWRMIVYGGAGHSFTNKDVDALKRPGFAYSASTDSRSWADQMAFFGEIFA